MTLALLSALGAIATWFFLVCFNPKEKKKRSTTFTVNMGPIEMLVDEALQTGWDGDFSSETYERMIARARKLDALLPPNDALLPLNDDHEGDRQT